MLCNTRRKPHSILVLLPVLILMCLSVRVPCYDRGDDAVTIKGRNSIKIQIVPKQKNVCHVQNTIPFSPPITLSNRYNCTYLLNANWVHTPITHANNLLPSAQWNRHMATKKQFSFVFFFFYHRFDTKTKHDKEFMFLVKKILVLCLSHFKTIEHFFYTSRCPLRVICHNCLKPFNVLCNRTGGYGVDQPKRSKWAFYILFYPFYGLARRCVNTIKVLYTPQVLVCVCAHRVY